MSKKPNIFVTRALPGNALSRLKKVANVKVWEKDAIIPRRELMKGAKGVDGLLPLLTDRIDGEVLDQSENLRIVANYAVGFDNIVLPDATERGIYVSNAAGKLISNSVAEHSSALILAMAKRVVEGDAYARGKKYKGWSPTLFIGSDLRGKTLGVIGTGNIGTRLVEMMHNGFGMKIFYSDIRRNTDLEKRFGAKFATKDALLKKADVVSVHVPLLPSTRHLISTKELRMMKKTAFLVNTSRGPVVDEKALVRALKKGEIGYAALDVFECEPAIDCDLSDALEMRKLTNIIMTPHIASASLETRSEMADIAVDNLVDVLVKGKKPRTLINKDVKSRK